MKRLFSIIILIVLSAASISAQIVIGSKFKPFTFEELSRPLMMAQQAYNETMGAIDELTEYIMNILASDIDTQMRNEMNVEYKAIQSVAKNLEDTGNLSNARSGYNRIKNSVRQKVVNYNNRIAQARQRAAQEQSQPRVQASTQQQPKQWSGTGFALNNGYICTNYHVIDGAKSIEIHGVQGDFTNSYSAKVVTSDKFNDLAILKVDDVDFKGFGTIPYKVKTSMAEVGEEIFVLGYPLTTTMGDEIKLTTGVVSSRTGYQGDVSLYQISAPIQPGNSGGPLFDSQGNLIGIVSAKHTGAENVGYAIKASYLRNLMESSLTEDVLPVNNSVSSLPLTGKVKKVKNFVYFIECSSNGENIHQGWSSPSTLRPDNGESARKSSNSNSKTIKVGEQTILYIDSSEAVWWESDDPDIATITKDGLVTGISPGEAYIWAHIGDAVKLYKVSVRQKENTQKPYYSNVKPQNTYQHNYNYENKQTQFQVSPKRYLAGEGWFFDGFCDLGFSYAQMTPAPGFSFPVSFSLGATYNVKHYVGGGLMTDILICNDEDGSAAFPLAAFIDYVKPFRKSFLDCRIGAALYMHTADFKNIHTRFSTYLRLSYSFLMTAMGDFGVAFDTFIPGGFSVGLVWAVGGGHWKCH